MTHNLPASMLGKHTRPEAQDASQVTSPMSSNDKGLVPSARQKRQKNDTEYDGPIQETYVYDRSIKFNTENEPETPFDGTDEDMDDVSSTYSTDDNESGIVEEEIISMEPLECYSSRSVCEEVYYDKLKKHDPELPTLDELKSYPLNTGKDKKIRETLSGSKSQKTNRLEYHLSLQGIFRKKDIHDCFIMACLCGDSQQVEDLLELISHSDIQFDINIAFNVLVHAARSQKKTTVLTYLITRNWADISENDSKVYLSYLEIIKSILKYRAYAVNIKYLNKDQYSLLQSVLVNHTIPHDVCCNLITLILSYENSNQETIDIDNKNKSDQTALYIAVTRLDPPLFNLICNHTRSPDLYINYENKKVSTNFTGGSILHYVTYLYSLSLNNKNTHDQALDCMEKNLILNRARKKKLKTKRHIEQGKVNYLIQIMNTLLSKIDDKNLDILFITNQKGEHIASYAQRLLIPDTDELFQSILKKIMSFEHLTRKASQPIKETVSQPETLAQIQV